MNRDKQDALRKPFPKERIQKLPTGGIQLDYVSHAWVTDRLLEVDPEWTWKPLAFDEAGLPKFDEHGGLWIELTVCGVTRYGYGEPQGRDKFDQTKGAIGNALRNAAMRFGVALDLWAKEIPSTDKPAPKQTMKPTVPPKEVRRVVPTADEMKPAKKLPANVPASLDDTDRVMVAYASIGLATSLEALRTIWQEHNDVLDVEYNGTTIRAYIGQRKAEIEQAGA